MAKHQQPWEPHDALLALELDQQKQRIEIASTPLSFAPPPPKAAEYASSDHCPEVKKSTVSTGAFSSPSEEVAAVDESVEGGEDRQRVSDAVPIPATQSKQVSKPTMYARSFPSPLPGKEGAAPRSIWTVKRPTAETRSTTTSPACKPSSLPNATQNARAWTVSKPAVSFPPSVFHKKGSAQDARDVRAAAGLRPRAGSLENFTLMLGKEAKAGGNILRTGKAMLSEMSRSGIKPDTVFFNAMLSQGKADNTLRYVPNNAGACVSSIPRSVKERRPTAHCRVFVF